MKKNNGSPEIEQEQPKQQVMMVTPALARKWLDQNSENNRSVSLDTVKQYARDMKEGWWKLTHQGIAFSMSGELIDGQHRLAAIIMADVPIEMVVGRGFDVEYDSPIDQGRIRTLGTIFHKSTRWVAAIRCMSRLEKGVVTQSLAKLSLPEFQLASDRHLQEVTAVMDIIRSSTPAGVIAALAWSLPIATEHIMSLTNQIKSGEMLERGDPAYALRAWLVNHPRSNSYEHIHATCTTVRAVLEGRKLSSIQVSPGAYMWICVKRRAMSVPNTPMTSTVPIDNWHGKRDKDRASQRDKDRASQRSSKLIFDES